MRLRKTIFRPMLLGVLLLGAHAGSALAFVPGGAANLVPHRAVYEMTLDHSRPANGVAGVRGRMVFEFAGSGCDGYTMNMRLVTRIEAETGRSSTTDLRSSTWEEGHGKRFRFNSSQYRGQDLEESTSGDAERAAAENDVDVHVNAPKPKELKVPGPVLFPTQHSIAILEAAKKGKSILQARVYDGSGKGDKVYSTTAFIGKPVKPGAKAPEKRVKNDEALEKIVSWPVSISYFDNKEEGTTPVYQLGFRFYANGISRDLVIDYGDFAIKGDLSSLELMPSQGCE
ncbi:MAG: cell envelope integrity EipB family protein [Methyloligellaceae bacterium]